MTPRFWSCLLAGAFMLPPAATAADVGCGAGPTITMRADNDVWGGAHQDQGYSAGFLLMAASPTLGPTDGSGCVPTGLGWLDRGSAWLGRGDARNVTLGLVQAIYTPTDREATAQDPDDRPFAGLLHVTAGRNVRHGDRLATTQLKLGLVGPSARAEQLQSAIHGVWGRSPFNGWDNQLRDEPVFAVVHERAWRWNGPQLGDGLGWDFGTHAGGSAGNLATHLNGGGRVRFGRHLPDDFGSSPLRPGGDNGAPALRAGDDGLGWHLYADFDARAVAHDVTLDGNTWKDSHRVDREAVVADLTLGAVMTLGPWRFAATHTRRSREFHGQREAPVFGTFTISRDH